MLAALVACNADLSVSPVDADQLDKEISEIHATAIAQEISSLKRLHEATDDLTAAKGTQNGYTCTGGLNPSQMSNKDYINAFAAGPCTPAIFLAGITGTRLQVLIDCETLKSQSPQIFADCKWTTCKKSIFTTGAPKDEYTIWIGDLTSPMNMINPSAANKKCFIGLFGMKWAKSSEGKLEPVPTAGATIKPMGFTPDTKTTSKCGFDAISGIMPNSNLLPEINRGYEKFRTTLEGMGYKIGLTLQAMPYDWRKPYYDNEVHHELVAIVEEMVKINGKKISVIAHSFGNINMANALSRLTSEQKTNWIKRYFALAPPYLGSPTTWSMVMGSQADATTMDFFTLSNTLSTFPAVYDLMPRESWSLYADTNWVKSIKNRILEEAGKPSQFNIPAQDDVAKLILPPISATCYDKAWKARSDLKCTSGLVDWSSFGTVITDQITDKNIGHSLNDYSYAPFSKLMFDGADKRPDYDRLDNPEVETVVLYNNMLWTPKSFYWDYDPRTMTTSSSPNFAEPTSTENHLGDGVVVTSSALIAAFKWAFEHDEKMTPNSKPIIFAELCSINNAKDSVYQQGTQVINNEYQGIACDCTPDDTKYCDHSGMIKDSKVVSYITNSLIDQQTANPDRKFNSWTEGEVTLYVNTCSLLSRSDPGLTDAQRNSIS